MLKDLVNKHKGLDGESSIQDLSTHIEPVPSAFERPDSSNYSRVSVKAVPAQPTNSSSVVDVAASPSKDEGHNSIRTIAIAAPTVVQAPQPRSFDDTEEDTGDFLKVCL